MTATVSVAMATYNGARFLREQLDSLAGQTLRPAELVIGDDQSSDETEAIVRDFATSAPFPVRFQVNPARLHFADNFLGAAARCSGEFVAFCDQDDIWLPEKLERSVAALKATNAALCAHDAWLVDERGETTGVHSHGMPHGLLAAGDADPWRVFFGFTCTFRRSLLDLFEQGRRPLDVIDPRYPVAHDRWVCFLAGLAGPMVHIDARLALYRQHGAAASGWMRTERGARGRLEALRSKFGYHLLKRRAIARDFAALAGRLQAEPDRWLGIATAEGVGRTHALWSALERSYAARLAVAEADGRVSRLVALAGAARRGAYSDAVSGRLASRVLAQDMAGALLARRGQLPRARAALPSRTPVGTVV